MEIIQCHAVFNKQCCAVGCSAMYATVYISSICIIGLILVYHLSKHGFQAIVLQYDEYVVL